MDCFVASLPCANASRLSQATTVLVSGADFAHNTHMPLKLYELVGTDASRPFSPFC